MNDYSFKSSVIGNKYQEGTMKIDAGREDELYYKDMKHNKPYWMDEKKS